MSTTSEFVKLRKNSSPKVGEWNLDYKSALSLAKKEHKFIITAWSNGDACGYCIQAEKCMMTDVFKTWMTKQNAYFVFQYSGDKDQGSVLHDWIFSKGGVKQYPGFRITLYDAKSKIEFNSAMTGNELRSNKSGVTGAKNMIAKLDKILAKNKTPGKDESKPTPTKNYKIRLNESLTTAQVNKILDAIDKAGGYCPCQPKSESSKCHCKDFINNKGIAEPCICKIYVKQPK